MKLLRGYIKETIEILDSINFNTFSEHQLFFFILAPCEKHIIFNISFQIFQLLICFFFTKNTVDKHDIFCLKNNVTLKKNNDYYPVSKLVLIHDHSSKD